MKKSALLLGNVCLTALLVGQTMLLSGCKEEKKTEATVAAVSTKNAERKNAQTNKASYWDEKSDINAAGADGLLPLVKAVKANDISGIQYLLDKGARVSAADKEGNTAIHQALQNGNEEIFKLLYNKESVQLRHPKFLKDAITGGNIELVKTVLDSGINVNVTLEINGRYRPDEELDYMDKRVVTALKKAVEENKPAIASLLLDRGAEGVQFFMLQALTKGNVDMVKALAEKIGNLRALSAKGMDLLAASVLEAGPDMISFLIEKNVGDINDALFRMMAYRKIDDDFMKIFDAFIKAGALPKSEMLQFALQKGRTEQFEKLAACLVNPNLPLENEDNLFFYALRHKYVSAVNLFLAHGADIFQRDSKGVSALEYAVKMKGEQPEIYEAMKNTLSDINSNGYLGETLLMILAQNGEDKEFFNIVEKGGDIWQKDHVGKTLLMYAAEGGSNEIINFLMKKGDNLSVVDRFGRVPLMYAAKAGKIAVMQNLIDHGASTNAADDEGRNVLMYAASGGHKDAVDILLDEGESAVSFDKNRKTVLMYALESGDMPTIDVILKKGVDVMTQDRNNRSPIHYAVLGENPEAVTALMKKKVNIYATDKYNYQPLTLAVIKGNKEIFDRLGAIANSTSGFTKDNGRTLLSYALEGGNIDILRWIVHSFSALSSQKDTKGKNFLMEVVRDGRPDIVREVLTPDARVIMQDNEGKTLLMYAAEGSNPINLITILSRINVEHFVTAGDKNGRTALMYAVGGKYNQNIKQQRLLQHGANANETDKNNKTVLMYAVGNTSARVDNQALRELLYHGAKVNVADNNGKTPLMYAAANPKAGMTIIESLLSAGADINAKDAQGKTVLMYAAEGGDISKFRLLLENGATRYGTTKDGLSVQNIADKVGVCFARAVAEALRRN